MNDEMERQPASLEAVIDALHAGRAPRAADLPALSALTPAAAARIARGVARLTIDARRALMQRLRDVANDNAEYDFSAVLRLGLDDPDDATRLAAIEGLWESEERWFMRALFEALDRDRSLAVRVEAARGLGRFVILGEFEDLSAREARLLRETLLARANDSAENSDVRRAALEALGADSDPSVAVAIEAAYRSGPRPLRLGAVAAMGRSCDPRWLPTLVAELGAEDPEMRFEAVKAVGAIGAIESAMHVVPLLGDEEADVQLAAVAALGEIGGAMAIKHLTDLAQHPDQALREAAEDALEQAQFNADPLGFSLN